MCFITIASGCWPLSNFIFGNNQMNGFWHNFFKKSGRNSIQLLKISTMKKSLPDKKNKRTGQKPLPGARTEKDADDLLHSKQEELPKEAGEEDLDDLVHQPHKTQPDSQNESKLEDPDDL